MRGEELRQKCSGENCHYQRATSDLKNGCYAVDGPTIAVEQQGDRHDRKSHSQQDALDAGTGDCFCPEELAYQGSTRWRCVGGLVHGELSDETPKA